MIISYLRYQNFIFILFIISGTIKFLFKFYSFPIDITLLFFILIVLDIFYNLLTNFRNIKLSNVQLLLLIFLIIFYALFFLSLFYSVSYTYGIKKSFYFILSFVAFIYPIFLRQLDVQYFVKIILVCCVVASLWFLAFSNLYYNLRIISTDLSKEHLAELQSSYGGLSLAISIVALYYIWKEKYTLSLLLVVLMLLLGSKGGVFFTVLIGMGLKWKNLLINFHIFKKSVFIKSILIFTPFVIVIIAFKKQLVHLLYFGLWRFESFFNFGQDNSTNERLDHYRFAIEHIFSSTKSFFLGYGIGSFGTLYDGTLRHLPHNIYLEGWFELGFLGFILIIIITLLPLFLKNRLIFLKIIALFFLLNSMKSGAFDEMRFMFGVYGLLIFQNNLEINNRKL